MTTCPQSEAFYFFVFTLSCSRHPPPVPPVPTHTAPFPTSISLPLSTLHLDHLSIQPSIMGFPSDKLRQSRFYGAFQRLLRVLQFLSSAISLGLFSARIYKIIRLAHRASTSKGAVEGILAAAALYTLVTMLCRFCLKHGAPRWLRLALIVFDIAFVAAFIAVAVLTRPHGGSSGPCNASQAQKLLHQTLSRQNCKLPWGTFVLAIFSTILHAITAIFHEVKDHRRKQSPEPTHEQKLGSVSDEADRQNHHVRPGRVEPGGTQ